MKRPPGLRRFLSLCRSFTGSDRELAVLLGTSPATVSRLKSGKIQKVERYVRRLESELGPPSHDVHNLLADLEDWARQSPQLLSILRSLHEVALDSAEL